ncbi:hypothetical protein F5Y18DRAFT_442158 [Xylariaceae sp. FL1019]|nr:hypothetical protein F5Y18DRAFT_442158 [Xylariaceae sp. FL1019]
MSDAMKSNTSAGGWGIDVSKDNDWKIVMLIWIFFGITLSLVGLRICYVWMRCHRSLRADDWLLIAATVALTANGFTIREWVQYTYEPSITIAPPSNVVLVGSLLGTFNACALGLSKTSIAVTFGRLTDGWWKSVLGLATGIIDILLFIQIYTFWLQDCNGAPEPLRISNNNAVCIKFEAVQTLRSVIQLFSCIIDGYFTFLPWKIVRRLRLRKFEKIGLAVGMSFGVLSLGTGLGRIMSLCMLEKDKSHLPLYVTGGYVFNYLEPAFTIIAACMPILRKLVADFIQWKTETKSFDWITKTFRRCRSQRTEPVLPLTEVPQPQAGSDQMEKASNMASSLNSTTAPASDTSSTLLPPMTPTNSIESKDSNSSAIARLYNATKTFMSLPRAA